MQELISHLNKYTTWAFDTETTEDHFIVAELLGISFYFPDGYNVYYNYINEPDGLEKLKPFFESAVGLKIGHEIKYDIHILKNVGVEVNGQIYDTKVAYWLLDASDKPFGLKDLGKRKLGVEVVKYSEAREMDEAGFAEYAKQDARLTYKLYELSVSSLKQIGKLEYYFRFEMAILRMLVDIERKGIQIDVKQLKYLEQTFMQQLDELYTEFLHNMFEPCNENLYMITVESFRNGKVIEETVPFNINSGRHLATLFYKIKNYPLVSKTEKGNPATHEGAIKQLVKLGYTDIVPLLKFKELTKLVSTYIQPFLTTHNFEGRVYPFYLQHGTATGRFSGKEPNPQNIPIKTSAGKEVRKCLTADEGHVFLDADFGQLELRIAAHWSQDPVLMNAFKNGVDVIDIICETVLGIKKEDQTKEKRVLAKAIAYGTLFGAGPKRLAEEAGIDVKKASSFLRKYFLVHKRLKMFQLYYPLTARQNDCYATTLYGRRRKLPMLASGQPVRFDPTWRSLLKTNDKENEWMIHAAEREALSVRIQGTAADIMKSAMLKAHNLGLDIRAQIHDELLVQCRERNVKEQSMQLKECMEQAVSTLSVPLVANIKVVRSWGQDLEEEMGLTEDEYSAIL